jgi:D-alanine transaminase
VREIHEQEVKSAQEIWLTSAATKEVLAVTTLDGRAVGDGKPGPLFRRMHGLFQDFKRTATRGK